MEVVQATGECNIGQRATVCSGVNERVKSDVRNRNKVINGIPPTDRWVNRMNKSRVRAVFAILCRT